MSTVAPATAALAIENAEVVYNHSVQALRGLSIEVPAGKIVALLGSNGAGKTTTLKAASGILPFENGRVASGHIRFFGDDIGHWPSHRLPRQGLAHVREGRHVFEDLTVDENLVAAGNALIGRQAQSVRQRDRVRVFPAPEGAAQAARRLSVGRRTADARDRPRVARPAAADAARRAVARARADWS